MVGNDTKTGRETMSLTITNEDCMELMARYPDGYFDLAIVELAIPMYICV